MGADAQGVENNFVYCNGRAAKNICIATPSVLMKKFFLGNIETSNRDVCPHACL